MWLINTSTLILEEFLDNVPPYVILSHTWNKDELSFRDIQNVTSAVKQKAGYKKVQDFCNLAQIYDFEWAWVDTCSIDKSSSSELTEAINSMFKYYENAEMCIVHLEDYTAEKSEGNFSQHLASCRWLYRGWTLQELVAPEDVRFFNKNWKLLGSKDTLLDAVSDLTKINKLVLSGVIKVSECTVAERFSWASMRRTTRDEDIAYCLFGLFNVHMPLLYGEGKQKAFRRLQIEITKVTTDLSLFLWSCPVLSKEVTSQIFLDSGLFADDPSYFSCSSTDQLIDYSYLRHEPPSLHPPHIVSGPRHDPFDPPIQTEAGLKANVYTIKDRSGSILVSTNCIDERYDQLVFIRLNRVGSIKLPFSQYCRRLALSNQVVLKEKSAVLNNGSTTSHAQDPFSIPSHSIQISQIQLQLPMPRLERPRKRTMADQRRTTLRVFSRTSAHSPETGDIISGASCILDACVYSSTAAEEDLLNKISARGSKALQIAMIKCYVARSDPSHDERFHFYIVLAKSPRAQPGVACWAVCPGDLSVERCLDASRTYTWDLDDVERLLGAPAADRFELETKGMDSIVGSLAVSHPQRRYSSLDDPTRTHTIDDQMNTDIDLTLDVNCSMVLVGCDCGATWKDVLDDIDLLAAQEAAAQEAAAPAPVVRSLTLDSELPSSLEASQELATSQESYERDSAVDMSPGVRRSKPTRHSFKTLVRSFTEGNIKEVFSPSRQSLNT